MRQTRVLITAEFAGYNFPVAIGIHVADAYTTDAAWLKARAQREAEAWLERHGRTGTLTRCTVQRIGNARGAVETHTVVFQYGGAEV